MTFDHVLLQNDGAIARLVLRRDFLGVMPPFPHPYQTQDHVGVRGNLARQPVAAYFGVGVGGRVPRRPAYIVECRSRIAETGRPRSTDISFIDRDETHVRTESPSEAGAVVVARIEHHDHGSRYGGGGRGRPHRVNASS